MRYLITGGAGFIGSHLADLLIAQGHHVHVVDNLSTGRLENIQHLFHNERFESTVADILDYHVLEQHISRCDQIFHLAAAVGVRLIMEQPVETIVTNVQGTENVLKLASYYRKKVLLASTSEVYGKLMETSDDIESLSEVDDWTLGPTTKRRWAYACSKAIDEFLALAYYEEKRVPIVIARFFNTVGPRQTGRYGMVIPNFVQSALCDEPINVFGDGEQSRCFTYVGDAIRAITQLMNTPEAEGEVFNIGSDEEISINELARRVRSLSYSQSEIVHTPYEKTYGPGFEDMRRRTPNIRKLKKTIGYEPTYRIDDILRDVIEYFRAALDSVSESDESLSVEGVETSHLHSNGVSNSPLPL
jgi:UDP-glucose 4-epimerase